MSNLLLIPNHRLIAIDGDKSATQKLGDSTRSTADQGQNSGQGYLDSAKEGLNNAANTISGKTDEATK